MSGLRRLPLVIGVALLLVLCNAGLASAAGPLHLAPPSTRLVTGPPLDADKKLADVNGDGRADLVIFGLAGEFNGVYVALATPSGFASPQRWQNYFCVGAEVCDVGDVNGDGKADILAFIHGDGQQDGNADVWVALSDGTRFGDGTVWNDGFCITEQTCAVGDLDGDGRADIVAFTPNFGLVWVSLSTGSGYGGNAVWQNYFCILGERCTLGDVNGDGRADLVAFKPTAPPGQKGNVLWVPSTGSGFGQIQLGHGYFCVDGEGCYVGDFNGDRKADVLTLKYHSDGLEAMVSLSNGAAFVNPSPLTWGTRIPGYTNPSMVGDVNADGRADVVTYDNPNGNTTRYIVNQTTDVATGPPPTTTGTETGVRAANFYNCVPEHDENGGFRPLYFWTQDLTTGAAPSSSGAVYDHYDDVGNCPVVPSTPYTVSFADQHVYRVVAVDPAGIACNGQNDPNVLGCVRQEFAFRGSSGGPAVDVVVPTG